MYNIQELVEREKNVIQIIGKAFNVRTGYKGDLYIREIMRIQPNKFRKKVIYVGEEHFKNCRQQRLIKSK